MDDAASYDQPAGWGNIVKGFALGGLTYAGLSLARRLLPAILVKSFDLEIEQTTLDNLVHSLELTSSPASFWVFNKFVPNDSRLQKDNPARIAALAMVGADLADTLYDYAGTVYENAGAAAAYVRDNFKWLSDGYNITHEIGFKVEQINGAIAGASLGLLEWVKDGIRAGGRAAARKYRDRKASRSE